MDFAFRHLFFFVFVCLSHGRPDIRNLHEERETVVKFDSLNYGGEKSFEIYVVENEEKLEVYNISTGPYVAFAEFKDRVNTTGYRFN